MDTSPPNIRDFGVRAQVKIKCVDETEGLGTCYPEQRTRENHSSIMLGVLVRRSLRETVKV